VDTILVNNRIKRFITVGISAYIVNAVFMIIFVEILHFSSYLLKNMANILSIEVSILFNFLLSRKWTWQDAPRKQNVKLLLQFIAFNLAALAGVIIRILMFALLEKWEINYLLNMTFGITLAASVDYLFYNKFIFRRNLNEKSRI